MYNTKTVKFKPMVFRNSIKIDNKLFTVKTDLYHKKVYITSNTIGVVQMA